MLTDPELYALVHRGTPGDLGFYLRQAEAAETVLELGCGAGRILVPLAEAGHQVVGVDLEGAALSLIRAQLASAAPAVRRRVRLVEADMTDFQLEDRFELVIIPFNTLYCLGDEAQILRCLRRARAHLAPHGRVVWDAYAIDGFHQHGDPVDEEDAEVLDEPVVSVQRGDTVYDVFENTRWDRDAQLLEVSYRYQPRDGSPAMHQTLYHRYLLTHQVAPVCQRAGLRLLAAHGDFDGTPLSGDSEHMVCITEKSEKRGREKRGRSR